MAWPARWFSVMTIFRIGARSGADALEQSNGRAARHQFQPLGDAGVRLTVDVAAVPDAVALLVGPSRDQPDLVGVVQRAEYFHAEEPGRVVDEVGAGGE